MLKNKMTALMPVGAGGQSNHIKSNDIISENAQKCNGFGENIFIKVKSAVTMTETAQKYGVKVNDSGLTNCIFHNDHHPSMKLYDDHFHCFACNAHGDVIAFVAQLLSLSQIDAAKRIAADCGIDCGSATSAKVQRPKKVITENDVYKLIDEYVNLLKKRQSTYAPQTPNEELHPYYVQAVHELPIYENYLDTLVSGTDNERQELMERRFVNGIKAKLRCARVG